MMYKHQIDDCIKRTQEQLNVVRKYQRKDEIKHLQARLDSLYRIREKAPRARFGVKDELETF